MSELHQTEPRLVSIVEAARLLGMSRSTVYELIAAGQLRTVCIGRSRRVLLASLDAYVDALVGDAMLAPGPSTGACS